MPNPYTIGFKSHDKIENERRPVDKYYVWPYCDYFEYIGSFSCTHKRLHSRYAQAARRSRRFEFSLHHLVPSRHVSQTTSTSTFALRNSVFNIQNILTNENGNVNGILELDASLAAPRWVGPPPCLELP
ncbi:hypothetical protein SVAN01_06379 [Stagonosporopsis vannaccii]|nr:hypothetical protein SVAN01_06379 [Stagonosporopsis vannaccii]